MGKKTSVYLDDSLAEAVAASGVPLAELIRRGLGVDGVTVRQAATEAAEAVRENLNTDLRDVVRNETRSALRDASGGEW